MPKEHILEGIEPDNLLGFLALLGFHRALQQAQPDWRPRVRWAGLPIRPRLTLSEDLSRDEVLDAAERGCETLMSAHSFDHHKDLNYQSSDARISLETAARDAEPDSRLKIDLLSALMSDVARKDDGTVRATPLCAMFGQGHQHFLERMETVATGIPPKELVNQVTAADLNSSEKIKQAIFIAWDRCDRTQSFRWDPLEDRRYALRFEDPSSDKGMTVHGANRLASLALPLLTAVPKRERGEIRLYAIGTRWNPGNGLEVSWPIWSRAASLHSVMAMISLYRPESPVRDWGISAVYTSERISVGKFFNFTRARTRS